MQASQPQCERTAAKNPDEAELTRRGFVVLAASAMGAFFLKPTLVEAVVGDRRYLVSIRTVGYGYLWPEEFEGTEDMSFFKPDDAELQREELAAGSVVTFEQDPEIPKGTAWLDVVSQDGEKLCDIPWYATPEEESAVMLVVDKINEGREVWGEVTAAEHSTIDAGPDNARIHSIEFDVFYR